MVMTEKEKKTARNKEYYQKNKEKLARQAKVYRQNNRDKRKEYRKQRRKADIVAVLGNLVWIIEGCCLYIRRLQRQEIPMACGGLHFNKRASASGTK